MIKNLFGVIYCFLELKGLGARDYMGQTGHLINSISAIMWVEDV